MFSLTLIKLSQLRLAPANVRRVPPRPEGIDQLAGDIAEHGLVQSVAAYKEGRFHFVFAGGRRWLALEQLRKAKTITGNYEVPVIVRTKAEAMELSLVENVQREVMHPADAYRAFARLRDEDGLSASDIAVRFGYSEGYVAKLLSLGSLAPSLLDVMGEDRLSIDSARALTITSDKELQVQLFEQLGNNAFRIRAALTNAKLALSDGLFVFVGRETYEAAGGTITADLFANEGDGYADDRQLVESLAEAKLATIAADLRDLGWQSVEVQIKRPDNYYSRPQLYPVRREPSEAEAAEAERIMARISEIEDSEPTSDELAELHERWNAIEQGLRGFPAELRAQHGILAFVDHSGELATLAHRVKSAEDGVSRSKAAQGPYSKPLTEQLTAIRSLALQQAVANDPALALDILLDNLAGQLLHGTHSERRAAQLGICRHSPEVDDALMTGSGIERVDAMLTERFADLPCDSRFDAIRGMAESDKMQLLAGLVASSINATIANGWSDPQRISSADAYAEAAGLDLSRQWTVPGEMFFRMKKGGLLSVLREACGDEAADNCMKLKRNDLALVMPDRLPADWLPSPMLPKVQPKQCDDEGELSRIA